MSLLLVGAIAATISVSAAQPSGNFEALKLRYREAVDCAHPYLLDSLRGGYEGPKASLSDIVCDDAAPKLVIMLRDKGLKAELVISKGSHLFVRVPHPDGPLFIDPTIRQFFGKDEAPSSVPVIFVGSLAELRRLFADPTAPPKSRSKKDSNWKDVDKNYLTLDEDGERLINFRLETMRKSAGSSEWWPLRAFRDNKACRSEP